MANASPRALRVGRRNISRMQNKRHQDGLDSAVPEQDLAAARWDETPELRLLESDSILDRVTSDSSEGRMA